MLEQFAQALQERTASKTLRSLRSCTPSSAGQLLINNKELVNFASNDYLGLSQHPQLAERSIEYIKKYGTGSGASRLLTGNIDAFEKIEQKLAALKGSEAALILPAGFQANSTVLAAILHKGAIAGADKLVHRSIIDGLQAGKADWFRFKHNDLAAYDELLSRKSESAQKKESATHEELTFDAEQETGTADKSTVVQRRSSNWLITESVFSMDGDRFPFDQFMQKAKVNETALYIDEAHATGVLGQNGMGLSAGREFLGISMGTFGKGLGSFGAYICCSKLMREYLINFCAGIVYSTALPPAVLGAIDAALDLVPQQDREREVLLSNADHLRNSLNKSGFDTGFSTTQIIPIILGSEDSCLRLSAHLEEHGFCVPAIRPPTVQAGLSRLRVSLSAAHTREQIDQFISIVRRWHEKEN